MFGMDLLGVTTSFKFYKKMFLFNVYVSVCNFLMGLLNIYTGVKKIN